jgi:Holliday junction resolvase RusA-like endonuclease
MFIINCLTEPTVQESIQFYIKQKIRGKAAPARSFAYGHTYNPSEKYMNKWRKEASVYFREELSEYEGPVEIEMDCFFKRPEKHISRQMKVKPSAPLFCLKKPDCDNINKFVLDCVSGVGFRDDKQVVRLSTRKFWATQEDCIKVTVNYLG